MDAMLVGVAGLGLTFGMWWVYYLVPSGEILRRHRDRAKVWGYIRILIVIAIVATGAGLHVAAYVIEGNAKITTLAAVLGVAIPVGWSVGLMYALSHTVGTVPPSMTYSVPVIDAARDDARKATRSATSSGFAGRPMGIPPSEFIKTFRAPL